MEKLDFIEKVASLAQRQCLFHAGDRIIVTVSGGADSVALLLVLNEIKCNCVVAHCNFHLRGEESMRDETFVRDLCDRLSIECAVRDFDVPAYVAAHGVSVEMACRELRYEWFEQMRINHDCKAIAVAHHSDDNIETLFLNILRGSGIAGMVGIRPRNGNIVRPLLGVSRKEIEDFLACRNQDYIVDSTNLENDAKRNKLRNIILPAIREQFHDADAGILRTLSDMYSCNEVYQKAIAEMRPHLLVQDDDGTCRLDLKAVSESRGRGAVLYEMLKTYKFNSSQCEQIMDSWNSGEGTGKKFISESYTAIIDRAYLDIKQTSDLASDDNGKVWAVDLAVGAIVEPVGMEIMRHDTGGNDVRSMGVNGKDKVCFNIDISTHSLTLRHWRQGDRFTPFGMHGTKLVSDLFTDMKLTEDEKRNAWLLIADDDSIVWVVGYRSSALFKVTPQTPFFVMTVV